MNEELRPCPFCGGEQKPDVEGDGNVPYEFCMSKICCSCGATVNRGWNTRPIEDALRARAERAEKMVERLIEVGERLRDYAILVSADHPMGDGQMALRDKSMWEYLVAECKESQLVTNAYKLKETK